MATCKRLQQFMRLYLTNEDYGKIICEWLQKMLIWYHTEKITAIWYDFPNWIECYQTIILEKNVYITEYVNKSNMFYKEKIRWWMTLYKFLISISSKLWIRECCYSLILNK